MKKLIGGLLVLAIFTSPTFSNIDYVSYEIYKILNQRHLYIVIKHSEESDNFDPLQIDEAMENIDNNARYISDLFKEREDVLAKIEAKMDLHSYARTSLTELQINSFTNFANYTRQSKQELYKIIEQIDKSKNLSDIAKEILHIDTDYKLVYDELTTIYDRQNRAIECLNEYISQGKVVLGIL